MLSAEISPDNSDLAEKRLVTALVISILLHLLLLFLYQLEIPVKHKDELIVEFLPELEPKLFKKRQIVETPSQQEQEPDKDTPYLSDRNTFAEKQQIKRGDNQATPPVKSPEKLQAKKIEPQKKIEQKPVEEKSLKLKDPALLNSLATKLEKNDTGEIVEVKKELDKIKNNSRVESYEPFKKHFLARSNPGSSDYLPSIPDGDVTMLNAKAFRYAIFVRRVATKVFGALRRIGWQELSSSEVRNVRGFVLISATLNKQGELIKTELLDSSGSLDFDDVLKRSVEEGAWDSNPPAGVESVDGTIKFIFKARTWSRPAPGKQRDRRWTLLGTGLL